MNPLQIIPSTWELVMHAEMYVVDCVGGLCHDDMKLLTEHMLLASLHHKSAGNYEQ